MFRLESQYIASWAVAALLCTCSLATDQLDNGSFETGDLMGWVDPSAIPGVPNASLAEPTIGAQDGSFACRLALASGVSELRQEFDASEGDEFNFSGYMLADSADVALAGNTFSLYKIVFIDENGVDLPPASVSVGQPSDPMFPGVDSLPFLNDASAQDLWIFSEAQGVAPAGTVKVAFLALNVDFGDGGIEYPKWFDNLSVTKIEGGMPGPNMLENPSFETGDFTGWVPEFNPDVENAIVGAPGAGAQEGMFAAELRLANGVSELRQAFPANPGEEFSLEGWMLHENGLPFGATFGLYKIVFQDENGTDLEIDAGLVSQGQAAPADAPPGIESLPILNSSIGADTWICSKAQGVAPAGTTQVVFLALNVDFANGLENPMWFDDISAHQIVGGMPGPEILENGGFETGDFTGWAPEPPSGNGSVGAPGVGAQDGSFAALLTNEQSVGELRQTSPASPGDEFNLNGYMLTENMLPGGPSFGLFKIVFRNADGMDLEPASVSVGQFGPMENPGVESLDFLNENSMVDVWQFSEAQGVAPEGTVEVLFLALNVDFGGGNNPIWFDNITATLIKDGGCDFEIGDVNRDGMIDLLDVQPFVTAITGEFVCEADINQDGVVDLLDVQPFVALLTGG